jgi:hypothetical protein
MSFLQTSNKIFRASYEVLQTFLRTSYDHFLYTLVILPLVNLSISDKSTLVLLQQHILDSNAGKQLSLAVIAVY